MPEEKKEEKQISAPQISLPKGGGAIRGIGEKFQVNPVTGTGSLSVPIYTTPGRSDFYPKLSLSYDSGSGNGPFGLGWNLPVPSITRKTDKGLPRYQDGGESDTFILSGAEDLVPELEEKNGQFIKYEREDSKNGEEYKVYRYRPRIEGLFARIERWKRVSDGDIHWKSISKDNVTSIYGKSAESRIFDPDDDSRVFCWLLEESYDDKGNVILYQYKQENDDNIDPSLPQEKNRIGKGYANRYLKRIKYGNKIPRSENQIPDPETDYLFEVIFDYGEHNIDNSDINESELWAIRQDSFSTYRAGFEIRTQRLCRQILMFHHFPDELAVDPYLVKSTDFQYEESPVVTYLFSVKQSGYTWDEENETYQSKSLPPLEFAYSKFQLNDEVQFIDEESLENLPHGIDGSQYRLIDLDGDGISGILTEQGEEWFYKQNLGNLEFEPAPGGIDGPPEPPVPVDSGSVRFASSRLVASKPSLANLQSGQTQIMDLAGDGQKDLVLLDDPVPGFFERTHDKKWESFVPFSSHPRIDWKDPNLRFIDLNGDGHTDILISENDVFTWYPSKAEEGFGSSLSVRKKLDEEKGPVLIFADATQSVYLADMSGDGLTDIVRIRNGEVCYWPNLGYGRFGAKITMDGAPHFDSPDQFNQSRIRLSDIDGSGTTDIIYLNRNGIKFWFNQSGNSWSEVHCIDNFPLIDNLSSVMVVDLLGNGTACIVWSSPLPKNNGHSLCYIDLAGGRKPHLMKSVVNNMGAETHFEYASSTKFYLEDLAAGKCWITRLPFPVHVVERVEARELVTDTKLVTLYKYHHGYFDGRDREFRGFGMVEQWDSESYKQFNKDRNAPTGFQTQEEEFHLPPVYTKTWFHTGFYHDRELISRQYEEEYYKGDSQSVLLADTILPDGLSAEEEHEACRALKGRVLRQEIYAVDNSEKSKHPYKVTESNYRLRCIQKIHHNLKHAVFYTYAFETLDYYYERNLDDPRISHNIILKVDKFGNVEESASIAYPRRTREGQSYPEEQSQPLVTYSVSKYINKSDELNFYRIGLPYEAQTYELTGLEADNLRLFTSSDVENAVQNAQSIDYENFHEPNQLQIRLIEHIRTLYYKNDLSGPLSLGNAESLALPYETYQKAFTNELLEKVYNSKISMNELTNILETEGSYIWMNNAWWFPSGKQDFAPLDASVEERQSYAFEHFYLPILLIDPFTNISRFTYDDNYKLLLLETRDSLDNIIRAEYDFRNIQPQMITDPNGNRSAVAFDQLGLVAGTALMGKEGNNEGDSLTDFQPYLDNETVVYHILNPLENPHAILKNATSRVIYDVDRFKREGKPVVIYTMKRETHVSDLNPEEKTKVQHAFLYVDGLGREVVTKIQAEPGLAPERDPDTDELVIVDDKIQMIHTDPRWVGTGRTIYDNKGNPIKKYEPFFSDRHTYEDEEDLVNWGVTPILRYDPLERLIRTDNPNGTFSKVDFTAWQQLIWDENDTVLDSQWFLELLPDYDPNNPGLPPDPGPEQIAAFQSARHAETPTIADLDVRGRTFLTIAKNIVMDNDGTVARVVDLPTRVKLDIEGNPLMITDARGNTVMSYVLSTTDSNDNDILARGYDIAGKQLYQKSMDAGERWVLNNIVDNPIRSWDSLDHEQRIQYDQLQRPEYLYLKHADEPEILVERTIYGKVHPDAVQLNLRGNIFQYYDSAGVITNEQLDFKGNLLQGNRRLAKVYTEILNWEPIDGLVQLNEITEAADPLLEQEIFANSTSYDALNRPISIVTPDNSEAKPIYNEANLLEEIKIRLRGEIEWVLFVKDINYNARGQRELIEYQNGTKTIYEYDPFTFRLIRLKTTRASDNTVLQDLYYTCDPVGNITEIRDEAQQTIYFNNSVVLPNMKYEYDALYQLILASGREHIGQTTYPQGEYDWNDYTRIKLPHPNDGQAMRRYTEKYIYDEVGSILNMVHQMGEAPGGETLWNRRYQYALENNRLMSTSLPGDSEASSYSANYEYSARYSYDAHGNMTSMLHLPEIHWNFRNRMDKVDLNGGGITYYVYDAAGQRIRKIHEHNGATVEERLYLGGFELYRKRNGTSLVLEEETLHVMDDKQRIALVETKTIKDGNHISLPTPVLRYQYSNHLGSASLELDEEGEVISYEEYYPYGNTSYQACTGASEVSLKRYRYTGKERDEESGFYYHGARYYASWVGRWINCDPIDIQAGLNIFRYAKNNPVMLFDPSGNQEESYEEEKKIKPKTSLQQAVFGGKQALKSGARNVSGSSGKPLEGTAHLWSEKGGGKSSARAARSRSRSRNYLMEDTPLHGPAARDFEACRVKSPAGKVPKQLFEIIWHPPSKEFAIRAVLSESAVMTHGKPSETSVQTVIERPAVKRFSKIPGGSMVLSGGLNVWVGLESENPVIKIIGIAGGSAEVTGGALFITGATQVAQGSNTGTLLMSTGRGLARYGGGSATFILSGYFLIEDIQRGDVTSSVGDAGGTLTGVFTLAGWSSGAAVAGAFTLGYGIGSLFNWVFEKVSGKTPGVALYDAIHDQDNLTKIGGRWVRVKEHSIGGFYEIRDDETGELLKVTQFPYKKRTF